MVARAGRLRRKPSATGSRPPRPINPTAGNTRARDRPSLCILAEYLHREFFYFMCVNPWSVLLLGRPHE